MYKAYITKFLEDGEICRKKSEDWNRKLQLHQALFSAKAMTIALSIITEIMVTKKDPLEIVT